MAKVRIKNLRLRTIIGANDDERRNKQDIIINAEFEFDSTLASKSDNIEDTSNYRTINKNIIDEVENSDYFLLEKLADKIVNIILEDSKVKKARVEIDKPGALRFSDSVSVEVYKEK